MKVLNLVWTEIGIDYMTETFYIGNDTAPEADKMQSLIWAELKQFQWQDGDIRATVRCSRIGDEMYKTIAELLKKNGYVELHAPEVEIIIANN